MSELRPFHLAIPVRDLDECRAFYGEMLGCDQGRSSDDWIDWDFFGHQLVTHVNAKLGKNERVDLHYNSVDGKGVPVPHFGVVLTPAQWSELKKRVIGKVEFIIEPYTRFAGETGEQSTMFFLDPSGNALEFKALNDLSQLFAR